MHSILTLHHAIPKSVLCSSWFTSPFRLASWCASPVSAGKEKYSTGAGHIAFTFALACIASTVTALHEAKCSRSSLFRRPSEAPRMPSQQTSLKFRSVLAGKAARPSSLILGQDPILKDSNAGCCLSTCTRSSSDIRDLHGPNSKPQCHRPMSGTTHNSTSHKFVRLQNASLLVSSHNVIRGLHDKLSYPPHPCISQHCSTCRRWSVMFLQATAFEHGRP